MDGPASSAGENPRARHRATAVLPHGYHACRRRDVVSLADGTPGRLKIDKRKLGIVAWIEETLAGVAQRVYLPLRVRQRQGPMRGSQYTLLLVPGRELQEVYTHLAAIRGDGTSVPATGPRKALGRGYYPAGAAIPIELSGLTTPGNYSIEIGTLLAGGENLTTIHYFYHAGW